MPDETPEYYRRDRLDGVTPPNLLKISTLSEHIVCARGKSSQYTSVSFNKRKIKLFGPSLYKLKKDIIIADAHTIIDHADLICNLQELVRGTDKQERVRALQALRYAKQRCEALIDWKFDIQKLERKSVITWTFEQIQKYFARQ